MNIKSADLICLSHLRWGFVYQRPQHLMTRAARERRVFFVEEPVFGDDSPRLETYRAPNSDVLVAVPHLPHGLSAEDRVGLERQLLDQLRVEHEIDRPLIWYYTPMALKFSRHIDRALTIYDSMDELSAFKFAPPELQELEQELFQRAGVVFTGGYSLYEKKRHQHRNVHAVPSSVDVTHFRRARAVQQEPADQAPIPHPRAGFCGVVDERFDIELLRGLATARPDWHFIIIGPVVKIDPATLPQSANIHYLGQKSYDELPSYMSGWDASLLPFAHNESTRYISPTKTPEYIAAGVPPISTSIRDVVRPYGERGVAWIADSVEGFAAALDEARAAQTDPAWHALADAVLEGNSWDRTWQRMQSEILRAQVKPSDTMAAWRTRRQSAEPALAGD